jgi:putative spermidine/putrescine transport system permease protein
MRRSLTSFGPGWLTLPASVLVIVFFALPVGGFLVRSLSDPVWGFQNYVAFLEKPVYQRVLFNSLSISALCTLGCILIGYPLAYTIAHASEAARRALVFVVLIPFWTSILVRTFAWMVLLQKQGLINDALIRLGVIGAPIALIYNRSGVLIGMVQVLLPLLVLPLYSAMLRIDRSYPLAAATLGAPPIRNFLRIYLPLSLPGLMSGATLVFVSALGYYITPALLGGPADIMIAQMIERQIGTIGNWGMASALAVVLLAVTALSLALAHRLVGLGSILRN